MRDAFDTFDARGNAEGYKALLKAQESLRAALAEPVPEAVAWMYECSPGTKHLLFPIDVGPWIKARGTPLYAHPITPPASPDEKVVRLTREQHAKFRKALVFAYENNFSTRESLLDLLGDWPAQEGR
jgi:hypothetical protein